MTAVALHHGHNTLGQLLKHWRRQRGLSQLDLALQADLSARHLSFVENGRSRPGRDVMDRLIAALDLASEDRVALLVAAGLSPYAANDGGNTSPADDTAVWGVVDAILANHEPFPGMVSDRARDVLRLNAAARAVIEHFVPVAFADPARPLNTMHLTFDPAGLRPFIEDWPAFAGIMLARMHQRLAFGDPDGRLGALLNALHDYPDVPAATPAVAPPSLRLTLCDGTVRLRFETVLMAIGGPQDMSANAHAVELFVARDDDTRAFCHALWRR